MTQYRNALNQAIPYDEKIRLMALSVLQEECGRELCRRAYHNGKTFDWKEFNNDFLIDYADYKLTEITRLCEKLYGLNSLEKIAKRKKQHIEQAQVRTIT